MIKTCVNCIYIANKEHRLKDELKYSHLNCNLWKLGETKLNQVDNPITTVKEINYCFETIETKENIGYKVIC